MSIWFPTIKSRESPRFTCVHMTCHILLKNSWQGLQLCFKLHLNRRFAQKVMGFQICGNPNFRNFGVPNLGIPWQNDIWVLALWLGTKNAIKRKVMASPIFGLWWVLWICVCLWFVYAPKMLQLCINQLVVWFVQVNANNWPICYSS